MGKLLRKLLGHIALQFRNSVTSINLFLVLFLDLQGIQEKNNSLLSLKNNDNNKKKCSSDTQC